MKSNDLFHSEYEAVMRRWEGRVPWHRRMLGRIGLQGKLVLCFMILLSAALAGSCWVFVSQSNDRLADIMGEQARQMSHTLALASKSALETGDEEELRRLGYDLLASRNILFIGFLDADARPITLSSRDPDFQWRDGQPAAESLMRPRQEYSPVLGDYIEVVAPVLGAPASLWGEGVAVRTDGARLLGYVTLGISQTAEQAQLRRINWMVMGVGVLIVMMGLPLVYLLVRRIFCPIRELVDATYRIAAGDLYTQVAIDRPDIIGRLARSFNEMVRRVNRQQQDLEDANRRLAEVNEDLEKQVRQRTLQLEAANRQLSGEIAEKEDFLRAVSHDLNAPLRNVSGIAAMLLLKHRSRLDPEIVHRLERIGRNVEVEMDLIGELLELSRVKTRRQKMEPVDLGRLLGDVRDLFENDLRMHQIHLIVEQRLPVLICEKARIRKVFQNLIDNAIKYMGPKTDRKEIRIGCVMREEEVEFQVRDSGMGIEPEELSKVFSIFRRGRGRQDQNVAGKGIGLAWVKSIIETYHGRIWVRSRLGRGTVFHFTINGTFVPALNPRAEQYVQSAEAPESREKDVETAGESYAAW